MDDVTAVTMPLRRVQLVASEARVVAQALRSPGAGSTEAAGICTDIYLDGPDASLAERARQASRSATRAVLRDVPGEDALLLSLEVERDGWLALRRMRVPRSRRWLVLGASAASELFPHLPAGVAPVLAVRCRRTVLRHAEGWWVSLDEALQRWRTSAEALATSRNELVEAVPALPGAVLTLEGTGRCVPTWLELLLQTAPRCTDVFTWGGSSSASQSTPTVRPASAGDDARR
ncbi:MAG: hypothetical protein L0Y66_03760 [Myxococcaceae bacterium]|nr:hypothetical protein [Myxococcaceae bacterium]MCI0669845.1 hypothetical protein [Myxococcaceae bacterium]